MTTDKAIEALKQKPKIGELYFIPGRRSGLLSLLRDRYERKHGMTKRFLVLCNRGEKMTKEEAIKKIAEEIFNEIMISMKPWFEWLVTNKK